MKTGVLTFHAGFNHGAFLQAYALQNILFELNIDNEIIHYQDFRQFINEYKHALITRDLLSIPKRIGRVLKFTKSQRLLHKTSRVLRFDHLSMNNHYDAIVYGSDEIWNLSNCVFGYDPAYFGQFYANKKISYAPSFGSMESNTCLPKHVVDHLKKFSHLSVRDTNSQKIIYKNLGQMPIIVPDPTFLYDILESSVPTRHRNYILIYALNLSNEMRRGIESLAKEQGLSIISVGYITNWADINIIHLSPFQLLGFYEKARFVFTDLFHGTIFSILSNKNFALELSRYRKNKFFPMLNILGLTQRIFNQNFHNIIKTQIDYDDVNLKIAQFKKSGVDFLQKAFHENRF